MLTYVGNDTKCYNIDGSHMRSAQYEHYAVAYFYACTHRKCLYEICVRTMFAIKRNHLIQNTYPFYHIGYP